MAIEATETPTQLRYLLTALVSSEEILSDLDKAVKDNGGQILKSEHLGVRKLHFPINKKSEWSMVSIFFEAEAEAVRKIEAEAKITEGVQRFLLTHWNAEVVEERSRRNRRESEEGEK